MTVIVDVGGREFGIAPYKLGAMKRAAPAIDAMNAIAGAFSTMAGMTAALGYALDVLFVGLHAVDPALTRDSLDDAFGIDDAPRIMSAVQEVLAASGLQPKGEAPAPPAAPAEGALPSSLETSSAT